MTGSRLAVKAYLNWLVRVLAACLQCSPHTPDPIMPRRRGAACQVASSERGETRPGVSGLKTRGEPSYEIPRNVSHPDSISQSRELSFKILLYLRNIQPMLVTNVTSDRAIRMLYLNGEFRQEITASDNDKFVY